MGKKNKEIRIIKNPKNIDPTFVGDHPTDLIENYLNQQQNNSNSTNSNDTEKLVMKARHDSNRFYKNNLKNKSKPITSIIHQFMSNGLIFEYDARSTNQPAPVRSNALEERARPQEK